ncbi:unnamed protein product [Microthlaspi erraticum]|uniref:FBD domain-containing protein n=1 Tax=Microthlaspi erraticum TaxID=1685480 RepID=A0A6D2J6N6_9BRAS|nr:unnamed protein product [Microthlaspi erraticum]
MDRISLLPDELLLRILSLLPTTKDVVATMVLSQRWLPLWKLMPKLVYDDSNQNIEYAKFSRFVDRSLIFHEAPLDTLHFKLVQNSSAADVGMWTVVAVKRCVRELHIESSPSTTPVTLPRSFYTGCAALVTLKLKSVTLVDVSSLPSFLTLKAFSLLRVKFPGDAFRYDYGFNIVKRLFSSYHVLQYLEVGRLEIDNVTVFTVIVPSLKTLKLGRISRKVKDGAHGFVVDAPLLEIFLIHDYMGGFCVIKNDMPKIVRAGFSVTYSQPRKLMSCITSVKCLTLCLSTSNEVYPVGTVFHNLVLLRLCTCQEEWLNLLMCMLRGCPNLQYLRFFQYHKPPTAEPHPCWKEPSSVPRCLLSSLETLTWANYEGREEQKQVAAFILRSANFLKKATISSKATDPKEKLEMIKELSSSPRRSPTCQLIFY